MASEGESQLVPGGIGPTEGAAAAPAAEAPAQRFCTACGAVLAGAEPCAACAARTGSGGGGVEETKGGPDARALGRALGLYFAILGTHIVGFGVIALSGDESAEMQVWGEAVIAGIDTLLVIGWAAACRRWVMDGLRRVGRAGWYLVAAALAPLTFTLATVLVGSVNRAFGLEDDGYAGAYLELGLGWGMVVLMVAVQPAVVEELAFRGVIQGALGRVLRMGEAVAVAALMFMILHLMPLSFPHLFLIGLAAGWLRARSGSLYPPMLLHFLHNGLVVASEWWQGA